MERIPTGPLDRDPEAFLKFLEAVQEEAREDGRWKLVSVSLAAKHIDPLAVLESIYEPGERHAYLEQPQTGEAIAGAEAVIERSFSGPDRFAQAQDFCDEVLENTVAVGQLDLPLSGPKIFATFAFENDLPPDAPFPPAHLFVPRWLVTSAEGAYVATACLLVEPDGDVQAQAQRILAAHEKFSCFDYSEPEQAEEVASIRETEVADDYARLVETALKEIGAGLYQKVVLARRRRFESSGPLRPLRMLNRLRNRFPSCHAFSFGNGAGQSLIGATPERLVRGRDGILETEAIAGSAPRGLTAAEDALQAAALLESDKDRREHEAVSAFIQDRLLEAGLTVEAPARPRLLKLSNVQHLHSPFSVKLPEVARLLEIAGRLHPTPAVGGLPRDAAIDAIRRIEPGTRGLYAGAAGWIGDNAEGELVVTIRSGLIDGNSATLYAGAGVVEGSVPESEDKETVLKMQAMREALR